MEFEAWLAKLDLALKDGSSLRVCSPGDYSKKRPSEDQVLFRSTDEEDLRSLRTAIAGCEPYPMMWMDGGNFPVTQIDVMGGDRRTLATVPVGRDGTWLCSLEGEAIPADPRLLRDWLRSRDVPGSWMNDGDAWKSEPRVRAKMKGLEPE